MSALIAIGVGCRTKCSAAAIQDIVRMALSCAPERMPVGLFTLREKGEEPGIVEAAQRLGLPLFLLSRDELRGRSDEVETRSARAQSIYGVPSIVEAAALVGAGSGSALILPRISANGAACAVATATAFEP